MADGERATWRLQSTDGYSFLVGTLVSEANGGLVHELRLETRLPDEAEPATAIVTMPLSPLRLAMLIESLSAWLVQPLGAIASDPFEAAVDLALQRWHSLKLTFGSSDDVITTRGQVVCRLDLRHQLFEASMTFATDPTSLQLLLDGLKQLPVRAL